MAQLLPELFRAVLRCLGELDSFHAYSYTPSLTRLLLHAYPYTSSRTGGQHLPPHAQQPRHPLRLPGTLLNPKP